MSKRPLFCVMGYQAQCFYNKKFLKVGVKNYKCNHKCFKPCCHTLCDEQIKGSLVVV